MNEPEFKNLLTLPRSEFKENILGSTSGRAFGKILFLAAFFMLFTLMFYTQNLSVFLPIGFLLIARVRFDANLVEKNIEKNSEFLTKLQKEIMRQTGEEIELRSIVLLWVDRRLVRTEKWFFRIKTSENPDNVELVGAEAKALANPS